MPSRFTDGLQVWGFETVNGEKRYARHVYFEGPKGEVVTIRLVYDYRESRLDFLVAPCLTS